MIFFIIIALHVRVSWLVNNVPQKNVCRIAVYVAFLEIYEFSFNFTPEQRVKKLFRVFYISSPDCVWKFYCKKSINCLKQTEEEERRGEKGLDPAPLEV